MSDPRADRLAKYLAGEADADDMRELDRAIAADPKIADALLSEASFDVHLREILSGSALSAQLDETPPLIDATALPRAMAKRRSNFWMAAALLLVTVSGWSAAAYVANELGKARTSIDTLSGRIGDLERASAESSVEPAAEVPVSVFPSEVPAIRSMRGLLMAMHEGGDEGPGYRLLDVGTTAPFDQSLRTCAWGATEFRYDGGATITVERNTVVRFNETKGRRQIKLDSGLVHVTNLSRKDKRPIDIDCALATVRVTVGQVAVQVDGQQMAVEAAVNEVQVQLKEEGAARSFKVRRGQYLIIKPGERAQVMQGILELGLDPPRD